MVKKKSNTLKIIASVAIIIILAVGIIGTISVGIQLGWSIPFIGPIGLTTGTNSTSTVTSTSGSGTITCSATGCSTCNATGTCSAVCTQSSCPSGSLLPPGQVEFNMNLEAVYTDGTNSSIVSQSNVPTLALGQIQIGGKNVDHVAAESLVGYVSSYPLPAGSTAYYVVNETAFNSATDYEWWNAYKYTTGFVGTVSLFLLPIFDLPAIQVYSDLCTANSTGGVSCTFPNANPVARQVTWNVAATVTVTAPAQFAVAPFSVSNLDVAAADFSALGITGCTNCGSSPAPAVAATMSGTGNSVSAKVSPPSNPNPNSYSSCPTCSTPSPPVYTTVTMGTPPTTSTTPVTVTGTTSSSSNGGNGSKSSGSGTGDSGSGMHGGPGPGEGPGGLQKSLLPVSYVALSFSGFQILNSSALIVLAIIWIVVMAALVSLFIVIYRVIYRSLERKR